MSINKFAVDQTLTCPNVPPSYYYLINPVCLNGMLQAQQDASLCGEVKIGNQRYYKHLTDPEDRMPLATLKQLQEPFFERSPTFIIKKKNVVHNILKGSYQSSLPSDNQSFLSRVVTGKGDRDDNMLLHVIGDIFGKGTELEGNDLLTTTAHIERVIELGILDEEFKEEDLKLDNKKLLLKNLKRSKQLSYEMLEWPLKDFRDHLMEELKGLKPEESVLLKGGWSGKKVGHAMLYGIQKTGADKYSLIIYNTGAGLEKHTSFNQNGKSFSLPVKKIVNIKLEDLTSYTTLHSLKQLVKAPNEKWTPHRIYDIIFKEVGGELSTDQYQTKDLFLPQFSGTCSYRVLTSYLHQQFSNKNLYLRADFKIKLKTLVDFINSHQPEEFVNNELKRKLVEKAATFFSKEILELYEKSIISDEEFGVVAPFLGRCKDKMGLAEKKAALKYSQSEVERFYSIEKRENNRVSYPLQLDYFHNTGKGNGNITSYLNTHSREITLTEEKFQAEFQRFFSHIDQLYKNNELESSIESIRDLTSRLGFDNNILSGQINVEKIIHQMSEQELFDLGSQLNRFTHILIKSSLKEALGDKTLEPSRYLSQMKIIATLNLAMNRFCQLKGLDDQNLFSRDITSILEGKNTYFLLFDPKEEEEFSQLQSFLNGQGLPGLSFFESSGRQLNKFELQEKELQEGGFVIPYLDWDYLRTQEFHSKFYSHFGKNIPDYSSEIEKLSLIFSDYYSLNKDDGLTKNTFKGLPKLFYDAREVTTISNYLLTSFLQVKPARGYQFDLDKTTIDYHFSSKKEGLSEISKQFFGLQDHPYSYDYSSNERDGDFIYPHIHFKHARKPISLHPYIDEKSPLDIKEEQLQCPTLSDHRRYSNIKSIGVQRYREISSLYLEKKLQIVDTLGFFKENLISLKTPPYQGSFEHLIFEPNVLIKELTRSKEQTEVLVEQFKEFLKDGYDLFSSLEEYDALFFFLETSTKLSRYMRFLKKNHPEIVSSDFKEDLLDVPELLKETSSKFNLSQEQKNKSKALLAIYFSGKDSLSEDELASTFSSYIYYQAYLDSNVNKQIHFDLQRSIEKQLFNLKKFLGNDREKISRFINKVLKGAFLNQKEYRWKNQANFQFVTEDSQVTIDFKNGVVKFNGSVSSDLDISILQNAFFQKFFPNPENLHVLKLEDDKFEITTAEGFKYRVLKREGSALSLQRAYDNKWYQYFDPQGASREEALQQDKGILGSLRNFCYYITGMKEIKPKYLKVPAYFFSGVRHQMFFSEDLSEILSFNSKTHLPEYKLKLGKELLSREIYGSEVVKLAPNGEELGETLIDLADTRIAELFFLNRFESRDYTLIWKENNSNNIKSIEFPNCGLVFTASKQEDGRALFLSKQYKGFFISKNQFVEALGNYGNFIILENHLGKRIALFPNKPLKKPKLFPPLFKRILILKMVILVMGL